MNIALDIDGVIADTSRIIKQKVVEEFNIPEHHLTPGDYTNIYILEHRQTQDKVNDYIRNLFQKNDEVYQKADEIHGAWLGSYILKPKAYITRRPEAYGIGAATEKWLKDNQFYPAPVHFIPKGTCKSSKAKELGVDILVEDSPYEITSCRENGLKTLVMRYHYNDEVILPDTDVAHSWDDIVRWYNDNRWNIHVKKFDGS